MKHQVIVRQVSGLARTLVGSFSVLCLADRTDPHRTPAAASSSAMWAGCRRRKSSLISRPSAEVTCAALSPTWKPSSRCPPGLSTRASSASAVGRSGRPARGSSSTTRPPRRTRRQRAAGPAWSRPRTSRGKPFAGPPRACPATGPTRISSTPSLASSAVAKPVPQPTSSTGPCTTSANSESTDRSTGLAGQLGERRARRSRPRACRTTSGWPPGTSD